MNKKDAEILDLKQKLESEQRYSLKLIQERDGRQQYKNDIRFMVNYWDNTCGNSLELFINCEMVVSERITDNVSKEAVLACIFEKIKEKLGI